MSDGEGKTEDDGAIVVPMGRMGVAWRCRECGQVLGIGLGRVLLLSVAVAVESSIRVQCRGCWGWQAWYPPGSEEVQGRREGGVRRVG